MLTHVKKLTHAKSFDPRKNYDPRKNILTHVTQATYVKIWPTYSQTHAPTRLTLPRNPHNLADSIETPGNIKGRSNPGGSFR